MALSVQTAPRIATAEQLKLAAEYAAAHAELRRLEALKKSLQNKLAVALGPDNRIVHPDDPDRNLVLLSPTVTRRFDSARFAEDHPELSAEYTTTVYGTRVTINA